MLRMSRRELLGGETAGDEQAYVLLLCAGLAGLGVGFRGHDDLDELPFEDHAGSRTVERPVEGDDAAECRGRVGPERTVVGLADVRAHRNAAGIRVLDDHAGGRGELPHALERRVGVGEVVERQLLALQLRRGADRCSLRVGRGVERCLLVRVFPVAQVEPLAELQR